MTPQERKSKIAILRQLHEEYLQTTGDTDILYIPKMAYRPQGKDEKFISFFPSELEKEKDIYTEFVSIEYDAEDPKRTLYLYKYNPHWREEYELVKSKSGFERHLIPVAELKVIDKSVSASPHAPKILELDLIKNPDDYDAIDKILAKLGDINITLNKINDTIKLSNQK
jgi:SRSO17 transposase